MTRTIAFQMDPLEDISIAGDSTFALMLEAQARGYALYEYQPGALSYLDGRVRAWARPVTVQREEGGHFRAGDYRHLDLGRDTDVVWVRQDPPFDIAYVTAAHLLERVTGESLVLNDPEAIRSAPEKLFVLDFARFMPPTLITRSEAEIRAFLADHGEIVVKPLHGKGGEGVFRIGPDARNLSSLVDFFAQEMKEPFIAQAFLPAVSEGDKRIILVDGEPIGAINRIPAQGEFRSNLVAGGTAAKVGLTPREREICAALGPELKRRGLLFTGIDVIGGLLTEINVTSPTGLVALDRFDGINSAGLIWDAVEERLK
ncbi:glutathione synthase [Sphingomicrobium astaxanthinifaciens]|uniref:glutathione synthase n=1 Tax=Sphingomicrobium astaxanthinifaciens TaxID=1227949 RepID=UPI001FCA9C21|nr:glutathione synthase [Sphingomicrobium astaxanthinifaciens]MCJ7422001.1 glutathione synthase [Sphingomicrobium astaxanthinifaciens]